MSQLDKGFRVEITLGSPMVMMTNNIYLDAVLGGLNQGVDYLRRARKVPMASKFFFLDEFGISDDHNEAKTQRRGFTRKPPNDLVAAEYLRDNSLLSDGKRIGGIPHKPVTGSGKRKQYGGEDTYYSTIWYSHAIAWGVGNIESITRTLEKLTNLGGKSRLGYGAIIDLKIIEDDDAYTHWAKRVLPDGDEVVSDDSENYAKVLSPVSGPYWDQTKSVVAQIYIGDCPKKTTILNS